MAQHDGWCNVARQLSATKRVHERRDNSGTLGLVLGVIGRDRQCTKMMIKLEFAEKVFINQEA